MIAVKMMMKGYGVTIGSGSGRDGRETTRTPFSGAGDEFGWLYVENIPGYVDIQGKLGGCAAFLFSYIIIK